MSALETDALIRELRVRGAETTDIEVKAAQGGCPKSLRETLSAFSNLAGGTVLLGLTNDTFSPVRIDAHAVRDAVSGMASDDMEPPVRADIAIEVLDDGSQVVRVDVPELDPTDKPCFVKSKGRYGGSFTRSGDGDRRLSNYEVDRLVENRRQPVFDREIVAEATLEDLDQGLLESYITRMVTGRPKAFDGLERPDVLRRLSIASLVDGELRPTLSATLTFGRYPQQFFPQLCISVVALPRTMMGDPGPTGERFLDSQTCDGPLPRMVMDAIKTAARNMTRASVVEGPGRLDRLEYPIEVVRELIVNAVIHRDYSPGARGAQVQVELYPDRFVVRSPGGFFGSVDPANFGDPDVSSSRNALLARMLADTPTPDGQQMVAENRGSGIPTVLRSLNAAGMAPPVFVGDFRRVEVTVPHHALLTSETLAWVQSLDQPDLTQAQVQALALMKAGGAVRNQTLRGWGLHPADATRELTDLVRRRLVLKVGDKRGASYRLAELDEQKTDGDVSPEGEQLSPRQTTILRCVRRRAEVTSQDLVNELGISYGTVIGEINKLIELGRLQPTAPPRSKKRTYVIRQRVDM